MTQGFIPRPGLSDVYYRLSLTRPRGLTIPHVACGAFRQFSGAALPAHSPGYATYTVEQCGTTTSETLDATRGGGECLIGSISSTDLHYYTPVCLLLGAQLSGTHRTPRCRSISTTGYIHKLLYQCTLHRHIAELSRQPKENPALYGRTTTVPRLESLQHFF